MWHGYCLNENLAMDASDWEQMLQAIQGLGPGFSSSPAEMNHRRMRLDGQAELYEALFTEQRISEDQWKVIIGAMIGKPPPQMELTRKIVSYNGYETPETTYGYGGTDYVTIRWFAGIGSAWMESGDECRAYLALFADQWELGA